MAIDAAISNRVEQEVDKLEYVAEHTIVNDGTLDELHRHQVLQRLLRKKCQ